MCVQAFIALIINMFILIDWIIFNINFYFLYYYSDPSDIYSYLDVDLLISDVYILKQ